MSRKAIFVLLAAAAFTLICAFSGFADTAYLKDGRVVSGKFENETLDYITMYESSTQWRHGLWKYLLSSVEINGVTYDVKPGEMMRPAKQALQPVDSGSSQKEGASTAPRKGTIVVQESSNKPNKSADSPTENKEK